MYVCIYVYIYIYIHTYNILYNIYYTTYNNMYHVMQCTITPYNNYTIIRCTPAAADDEAVGAVAVVELVEEAELAEDL